MSYKISLSSSELSALKSRQKTEKSVKIFQRLQCISMADRGIKKQDIATVLNVTPNTITAWVKIYREGGLDLLTQLHYDDRRELKLNLYKDAIEEYVKTEVPGTVSQVLAWLEEKHLFKTEHSWLYRYMKKNSIFLTKKQN